jgi:hypothetical protein
MSGQVLCGAPYADRAASGQAISACSATINVRTGITDDTSFHSFFGPANITLMPVLAVDILQIGAKGQGLLMGAGGVGSLLTTLWLSARSNVGSNGWRIIDGGVISRLSGDADG